MQIVVKKKVLEALVDKVMREVSSFHSVRIDEIPAKVDEEDVIKPTEEMSTQLSQQKPKVDDPAYKPVNTAELSKALAALGEKVPQDKVQAFYKRASEMTQKAKDGDDEDTLSEARINQIVSYIVGKPIKVAEAKGRGGFDMNSSDAKKIDAMAQAFDADVTDFLMTRARHDMTMHSSESLSAIPPLVMSGVNNLISAIEKKRGAKFKRPQELASIKNEILQPGGIEILPDMRKMRMKAAGTTIEVAGFSSASHNVTLEQMQSAAEDAVRNHFDDFVEYLTTGHYMGDSTSGIKRDREGTLQTEAEDVAEEVLIQLGEQIPQNSSIPEASLRSFASEIGEFIKTTLSPENNQFSFTFTDLVLKVKKGKKGEAAPEDDDDADDVSSERQVIIDLSGVAEDIQKLPPEVGVYGKVLNKAFDRTAISRVNTAEVFKDTLARAILADCIDLLDKYVKTKKSKFTPGSEGRNLASDVLRRMGGSRRDFDPAKINAMMRDIADTGAEEDLSPEEIERRQWNALYNTDVLSIDRAEMREQLFNAFMEDFFQPAVFIASKKFENSAQVSRTFQNATNFGIASIDTETKGSLSAGVYDLYMTLLKSFGDRSQTSKFFQTYNKILSMPEFSKFVADEAGATGISDLSRSKTSFFDKDTTLILIVNLASDFAKKKLRQPTVAYNLTGKKDGADGTFNIASAFGRYCEKDVIDGVSDGDANSLKLIDKVADLMDQSGMGFTRIPTSKKGKQASPVNEIAKLRSIIRKSIR